MLNEQTIEKLMDLHLREMAQAFRAQMQDNTLKDMSFEDRFGLLGSGAPAGAVAMQIHPRQT
jgi:hypothetical protein